MQNLSLSGILKQLKVIKVTKVANFIALHCDMAVTKSAKKAIRQNKRRRVRNLVYLNKMKKLLKEARVFVLQKKIQEAKELLPKVYQILDKAAKAGVIKKNAASRKKSRITKLVERFVK